MGTLWEPYGNPRGILWEAYGNQSSVQVPPRFPVDDMENMGNLWDDSVETKHTGKMFDMFDRIQLINYINRLYGGWTSIPYHRNLHVMGM